jgi:hypothetical protein
MRLGAGLVASRGYDRDPQANRSTWMLARRGGRESEKGVSAGAWSRSTGAGWIDCGESGRERSPPAWSQRSGTGKRRRSEEVWLMTCRLGSVSAATPARSRMRTPRSRSCGCRNAGMGRAAGVVHPGRGLGGKRPFACVLSTHVLQLSLGLNPWPPGLNLPPFSQPQGCFSAAPQSRPDEGAGQI